jgi:MFS family permease
MASAAGAYDAPDRGITINPRQIFWASFLTLIAAGIGFSVRGGILGDWAAQFGFTKSELGTITGGGLIGFGFTIIACSIFADRIGYRALLMGAFVLHLLSAVITLAATPIFHATDKDTTYWCLFIGMFMFALGNGLCEAAINPLVATLYPRQKTHYLNILHAGWPAGLIIGALIAYFLVGRVRWEIPIATFLIPTLWYGYITLKERFPVSEVKAAGVSFGQTLAAIVGPIFILLVVLHALIGYVELGTDSWITNIFEAEFGKNALLLFIYTSALMFVLRFFAGPIVHRINPLGLLLVSAIMGATGLYLLGAWETGAAVVVAATIYGLGKTFLWPTMLGVVGERFPKGGALAMGIVGGVGMLSAGFLGGPGIGYKQDRNASAKLEQTAPETYARYRAESENRFLVFKPIAGLDGAKVAVLTDKAGPGKTLAADLERLKASGKEDKNLLALAQWWEGAKNYIDVDKKPVEEAGVYGGRQALKLTALIPATMAVGFLLLVVYFRMRGGYKAVHLDSSGREIEVAHDPDHDADETLDVAAAGPKQA